MGGPKQKGVVTYCKPSSLTTLSTDAKLNVFTPNSAVSPFRQRALKGTLHGYIFNGYSRAMRQAPYMLIPFSVGALHCLRFSWSLGADDFGCRIRRVRLGSG
jgi:hypothetical protein